MTTLLYFVVALVVVLVAASVAARGVFGHSVRRRMLTLGVLLAAVRVGSLWFLQYHAWHRSESLSYLPLVLLLFPEAFAAERLFALGPDGSAAGVLGFSALLTAGSFLFAVAAVRMENRLLQWMGRSR